MVYRDRYHLREGEHREIACLINAGVPQYIIARHYGITSKSVYDARLQLIRWLSEEHLASDGDRRFYFAQQICGTLPKKARPLVSNHVFRPVLKGAAESVLYGEERDLPFIIFNNGGFFDSHIRKENLVREAISILSRHNRKDIYYLTKDSAREQVSKELQAVEDGRCFGQYFLSRNEACVIVDEIMGVLTEREREIIRLYYSSSHASFADIGRQIGITREWPRKLVKTAGEKMQKEFNGLFNGV